MTDKAELIRRVEDIADAITILNFELYEIGGSPHKYYDDLIDSSTRDLADARRALDRA